MSRIVLLGDAAGHDVVVVGAESAAPPASVAAPAPAPTTAPTTAPAAPPAPPPARDPAHRDDRCDLGDASRAVRLPRLNGDSAGVDCARVAADAAQDARRAIGEDRCAAAYEKVLEGRAALAQAGVRGHDSAALRDDVRATERTFGRACILPGARMDDGDDE
mgnify:CR=1 FL=1